MARRHGDADNVMLNHNNWLLIVSRQWFAASVNSYLRNSGGELTLDAATFGVVSSTTEATVDGWALVPTQQLISHQTVLNFGNHSTAAVNRSLTANRTGAVRAASVFESQLIIPMYVVIFLLSVVGNVLVLITLAQNKRMRTVTNVYLLNLAMSDLLLGVFCMPFTLVGQVLRNFIFGAIMCKLIPYFQAVSVSVGVWTLVAISLERYFAICRPLKSRRWQTQFHAYKMIGVVWLASLSWNSPILAVSTLKVMRSRGGHKCREEWPSPVSEQAYNLFLDAILLLVPLLIMILAYSLIMNKLWKGLQREIKHSSTYKQQIERSSSAPTMNLTTNNNTAASVGAGRLEGCGVAASADGLHPQHESTLRPQQSAVPPAEKRNGVSAVKRWLLQSIVQVRIPSATTKSRHIRFGDMTASDACAADSGVANEPPTCVAVPLIQMTDCMGGNPVGCQSQNVLIDTTYTFTRHAIRSNHMDKSIEAKRKVIRMLFVIVAEFFVCWAPLHVLNTWYLFDPEFVYSRVGATGVSLVHLLAYISSCCNPITYCFMNRKFRQSFVSIFDCNRCSRTYCCCLGSDGVAGHEDHTVIKQSGIIGLRPDGARNLSEVSGNSTLFLGRASTAGRSEVVVLETEDRV